IACWKRKYSTQFTLMFLGMVLLIVGILNSITPYLAENNSMARLCSKLNLNEEDMVGSFTLFKPSCVFYLKREVVDLPTIWSFSDFMNQKKKAYCFIREEEIMPTCKYLNSSYPVVDKLGKKVVLVNRTGTKSID
ncbi:MAG: hypothetical protein P9M03_10255, partial [Candidatus Theseobacter exili]|nr:hypothetical protein [Candidatus Theseobacter exili]